VEGGKAEAFECPFLSGFRREAACPAVEEEEDGFLARQHLSRRTQKQTVK